MLPQSERAEYVKRCRSYVGTDYTKFKIFLLERKSEQQDLAKFGGQEEESESRCDYCDKIGHTKKECFKLKRETKTQSDSKGNQDTACWRCGEEGHRSFECSKPDSRAGGRRGKGTRGNSGPSGGDSKSTQMVHSYHLRMADCNRCRNASQLTAACSGCGKQGNTLDHCLAHCTKYMQEGVGGKAAMVKKGQNCLICLHPGHAADKCFDKDNAKRVCGLEGCASHHHPTLHGAKDPAVVNCSMARLKDRQGAFSKCQVCRESAREKVQEGNYEGQLQ